MIRRCTLRGAPEPAAARDRVLATAPVGADRAAALLASGELDLFRVEGPQFLLGGRAPPLDGRVEQSLLVVHAGEIHALLALHHGLPIARVHRRWDMDGRWRGDRLMPLDTIRRFSGISADGGVAGWDGWARMEAPRTRATGGWSLSDGALVDAPTGLRDPPRAQISLVRPTPPLRTSPMPLDVAEDWEMADTYSSVTVYRLNLPDGATVTLDEPPTWLDVQGDAFAVWSPQSGALIGRLGARVSYGGRAFTTASAPPALARGAAWVPDGRALVRCDVDMRRSVVRRFDGAVFGVRLFEGDLEVLTSRGIWWLDPESLEDREVLLAGDSDHPVWFHPDGGWVTARGGWWQAPRNSAG